MSIRLVLICIVALKWLSTAQADGWPVWYVSQLQKMANEGMSTNTDYRVLPHAQQHEIKPSQVELLIRTRDDQPPTPNVPVPDRTIVLGIRNLDVTALGAWEVMADVFPFGFLYCEAPDGKIERRIIPPIGSWRGPAPEPDSIPLGERFWYPRHQKSVQEWFGQMPKEGRYLVWWEYRDKRSNMLVFRREGPALNYFP